MREQFANWYASLKRYRGDSPALGTIAGALVVLQRLIEEEPTPALTIDAFTAKGGSQVIGASGPRVMEILATFGETRPLLSEGGRTNRGLRGDIAGLLSALNAVLPHGGLSEHHRSELRELQRFLVERIRDFHNRQRLRLLYDPTLTLSENLRRFFAAARAEGKAPALAQYLVGAKLAQRFPEAPIPNDSWTTQDRQLGRKGDFLLGDTVFHVTLTPGVPLLAKCAENLREGLRPCLIVPEQAREAARQMITLDAFLKDRVEVLEIMGWLANNLEELGHWDSPRVRAQVAQLLTGYNARVDAVEFDKSLLIEIPRNLTSPR